MDNLQASKSKQARVEYIDIFRAFGIILMVMGHIGFGSAFSKWIHAFHMPMFFFISGWFYKKNDIPLPILIGKRIKTLLLPYALIGVAELTISYLMFSSYSGVQPLMSFLFTNTNGQSPVPGALWFLTAMFFTELIYICVDRAFKKSILLHIIVLLISVFGMVAVVILPFRLPWGIDAGCVGAGLFHIGCVTKGTKVEKILNLNPWITIGLGIAVSISIFLSPAVNMRTASYTGYPLFWLNALVAIVVGWNLARWIEVLLKRQKCEILLKWIESIGENSIVYLCLNQICIIITNKIMSLVPIAAIIEKIIILILVLFELWILEKVICNTKLRVIIGK